MGEKSYPKDSTGRCPPPEAGDRVGACDAPTRDCGLSEACADWRALQPGIEAAASPSP